jgi:DNA-binding NarL/FixJ family response regulator
MVTASAPVRVLVVDDDPDVRHTLQAILSVDPAIVIAGLAADGHRALAEVRRQRIDVMLLDIRMPHLDGLATLESVRRDGLDIRVVILTTFGDTDYVRRAISAGADGFLLKSGDPHHLIEAVHATARGETWLSPAVASVVAADLRRGLAGQEDAAAAQQTLTKLTPREREIATLLAHGLSNAEIAHRLFLSESTVKAYVSTAMARVATRNRVELAVIVWRTGTIHL